MEKTQKYNLKVAVVILNYNGLEHLQNYLPSITKYLPEYASLFVADNGSTDGSVAYLRQHLDDLTLICLERNTGYAGGYNNALNQIEAEYYYLINSDVEFVDEGLTEMVNFLDQHADFAACQPKIRSMTRRHDFEYAGAAGGWLDQLGYPFCRGRILDVDEPDHGQYDQVARIFWATGAALLIRAEDFHFVGGFDPDFFAHMEEIDLAWRLQRMGKHIAVIPGSQVFHLGGGTLDYTSPRKTFLNFRNSLFILVKNERGHVLPALLFLRLILDGVAAIRFILQGDFGNFKAIWKAHMHLYRTLGKMWKKRKNFLRLLNDHHIDERIALDGRYRGSIVWDYYIRGKNKFSELNIHEKREKKLSGHI